MSRKRWLVQWDDAAAEATEKRWNLLQKKIMTNIISWQSGVWLSTAHLSIAVFFIFNIFI